MDDLLNDILRAADRHPNSRVSKLIRTVEEDPSQKNIVLLLIELSDHAEYATDFNISLRYYLDLFEKLGINRDLILNEAGLLLVNSSKIYSKRVDYVQSLVERQILTLSNADHEIQQQKEQNQQESSAEKVTPTEKPKRGRKRALDAPTDPYEVQLEPRKFKKMTEEKRFALPKTPTKTKSLLRNIEVEQQIHPAGWMHATIYDLENDEEVDTKRNYKLFTYHIEHRYNTLVPDINFRLHFKVKDYLDEQEENLDESDVGSDHMNQVWPPLSEEYVQKYINLENHVLQQEIDPTNSWISSRTQNNVITHQVLNDCEDICNGTLNETSDETPNQGSNANIAGECSAINDSGMGTSILNDSIDATQFDRTLNDTTLLTTEADKSLNSTQSQENDSALGESLVDQLNNCNETSTENTLTNKTSSLFNDQLDLATKDSEAKAPTETVSMEATIESAENSNETEYHSNETKDTSSVEKDAELQVNQESSTDKNISGQICETSDIIVENQNSTEPTESGEGTAKSHEGSEIFGEKETATPAENNTNSTEIASEGKGEQTNDGIQTEEITESTNNSDNNNSTEASEGNNANNTKTKEAFLQLEVHVMNDNETEPSERLQLQIPNMDDEGVHLSDTYENDFRMLSPTIKLNNIMPGVTNKDVTIRLDDELREVLELRDDMMEHFSNETYKVPVLIEPKEHPLLFNIFKLPPKQLRRRVLFKLGPDMDLFLKARSLKPSRPAPPFREYRMPKNMQFFPLNNTDMAGITDTPPNSPGHDSEFCGFTDSESVHDEDTCTEFCGFTDEEQINIIINTHRLSRDSGVGVDVNILTPEKEALETIFEETGTDILNCRVNLNTEFANVENATTNKEDTDDLLNNLPEAIRDALEAEIQDKIEENNVEHTKETSIEIESDSDKSKENQQIADKDTVQEPTTSSIELTNSQEEQNAETSAGKQTEDIVPSNEEQILAGNTDHEMSSSHEEENPNQSKTSNDNHEDLPGSHAESSAFCLENSVDSDKSQQDGEIFDLNFQDSKTKIQKWHEHLRPILTKSRERHHFDVFQLGTEIIDTIQTVDTAEQTTPDLTTFADIMDKKDKSYVSRYFLSTLLLANQSNVDILVENKSSENPSSWCDIKLKLLSTKRHTVAIEDNIGMINNKKRKQNLPIESKVKTKKIKSSQIEDDDDDDDDMEIFDIKSVRDSPTKRSMVSELPSTVTPKKFREATINSKESISKHIVVPAFSSTNILIATPTTSKQVSQRNIANCEVNLNNIRILQPIEKVPRQGDDYDSGIFSIGEMSIT